MWPCGVAFFDDVKVILAYCEKRQQYRHFRIDRLVSMAMTEIKYPQNHYYLIKKWLHHLGAGANDKIWQSNS
ncbi:WYL domain-containing protein [uncultured Bartonella sp.]|uniref:WYL domain-containing protein n=1 Tax=uncultured Bartonella sp. TaxID=104108 RepID=UPI00260C5B2C|nr:WYL domain-containing protein [uncultured Bartonella sp.]